MILNQRPEISRTKLHDDVLCASRFDIVDELDNVNVVQLSKNVDLHGDSIQDSHIDSWIDTYGFDGKHLLTRAKPTETYEPTPTRRGNDNSGAALSKVIPRGIPVQFILGLVSTVVRALSVDSVESLSSG